ncbi:hypothetical protein AURDEDRAFT_92027 [Auricularia subglabra TFB-10046 SS5]|nr:hypothetical protein AURDEDRAFT_92027 [Auricularia subglabra TFB-10046 SS5]
MTAFKAGLHHAVDVALGATSQAVNGVNPFPNALHLPQSIADVQRIVGDAKRTGRKVRVVGAAHTRPKEAILDDADRDRIVLVSLKKYRGVTLDPESGICLVKAGTNLGVDPNEPDSTLENSLCYIIDQAGWMIPETGGIIHQTVGGFLATASAGGSLKYSFHDAVIGFTLVDGNGDVCSFSVDDPDPSHFYAAACCAGLCGIITDIKLLLTPKSDIQGVQQTYSAQVEEGCPVNLFGDVDHTAAPLLDEYFERHDYCRMLYWPQPYLPPRLQIWLANRVEVGQMAQPYVELEPALQLVASIVLELIWHWTFNGRSELDWLVRNLLGLFVPLGDVRQFVDTWYHVLPMDNGINDRVIPTSYTEMWVSKRDATKAMRAVRGLHGRDPASVGNFFTEIYTAKRSPFWLSPSYSGDKIRLDVNWFQYNSVDGHAIPPFRLADPVPFFSKYWAALDAARIPYTTHLGKYRPRTHATRERLRRDYPRYDDWLTIRRQMDPAQVFLTAYWARELQIERVPAPPPHPSYVLVDPPPEGAGSVEMRKEGTLHRLGRHLRHVSEVAADAIRGRAKVPAQVARLQRETREERRRSRSVDRTIRPPPGEGLLGPRPSSSAGWYDDADRGLATVSALRARRDASAWSSR